MPADLSRGASISYELRGYQRVANSLRRLASDFRKETDDVIEGFAKDERAGLKGFGYPPQTNNPQPFKTEKQRRFFFWALDNGVIQVPYPRTGELANSWRARRLGWSNWVIENSAAYGAIVVGRGTQAVYHRGNWFIAQDVIEEKTPDLTQDLTERIVELAK